MVQQRERGRGERHLWLLDERRLSSSSLGSLQHLVAPVPAQVHDQRGLFEQHGDRGDGVQHADVGVRRVRDERRLRDEPSGSMVRHDDSKLRLPDERRLRGIVRRARVRHGEWAAGSLHALGKSDALSAQFVLPP